MKYKKVDEIFKALLNIENKSTNILSYLFLNGVNMKEYVD